MAHQSSKPSCRFAAACVKFGCAFSHPPGRKPDCRHGSSCTRHAHGECAFLHPAAEPGLKAAAAAAAAAAEPASTRSCFHGVNCVKFGCAFSHPPGRKPDCRHGSTCTRHARGECAFLHPVADRQLAVQSTTSPRKTTKETSTLTRVAHFDKASGMTTVTRYEHTKITVMEFCPYHKHAGQTRFDKSIPRDRFGNVQGPNFDLAPDKAFRGQNIVVLQCYTGEGLTFTSPKAALERKGFTVIGVTSVPPLAEFLALIKNCCQLWIISGPEASKLTPGHCAAIQKLVDLRKGLFLWADNDPYTQDANVVLRSLAQTSALSMAGNFLGDTILKEVAAGKSRDAGFSSHLTMTGLESMYEGVTIAAIHGPPSHYRTIMRASDSQPVTAVHDDNHVRIMMDGGYTRLCEDRWERTAGTSRFVTNAACWLYNFEGRTWLRDQLRREAAAKAAASA